LHVFVIYSIRFSRVWLCCW